MNVKTKMSLIFSKSALIKSICLVLFVSALLVFFSPVVQKTGDYCTFSLNPFYAGCDIAAWARDANNADRQEEESKRRNYGEGACKWDGTPYKEGEPIKDLMDCPNKASSNVE